MRLRPAGATAVTVFGFAPHKHPVSSGPAQGAAPLVHRAVLCHSSSVPFRLRGRVPPVTTWRSARMQRIFKWSFRWSGHWTSPWLASETQEIRLTSLALFLYVEGPFLPVRLAPSVIVFGIGFYLDRVGAGGKLSGGTFQLAGGPPVSEPQILTVEVQIYIVPGQIVTLPVLHEGPDGGAGAIDVSGGAHRSYKDSAPRNTAPRPPSTAGSRPTKGSVLVLSPRSAHAHFLTVELAAIIASFRREPGPRLQGPGPSSICRNPPAGEDGLSLLRSSMFARCAGYPRLAPYTNATDSRRWSRP